MMNHGKHGISRKGLRGVASGAMGPGYSFVHYDFGLIVREYGTDKAELFGQGHSQVQLGNEGILVGAGENVD